MYKGGNKGKGSGGGEGKNPLKLFHYIVRGKKGKGGKGGKGSKGGEGGRGQRRGFGHALESIRRLARAQQGSPAR